MANAVSGLGGVIRDALGTGLGAKPICNTDVFCVATPELGTELLPAGVLHPKRVLKGIVAGVRDYGSHVSIPVNGSRPTPVISPTRWYSAGSVGVLPRGMSIKKVEPDDRIVAIGGRTGRDGIHGATFSSIEAHRQSESLSGGSVQIGNAIVEKMVLDVIVQARDQGLFRSITDCGAGGFQLGGRRDGEPRLGGEGRARSGPTQATRGYRIRDLDWSSQGGWCWPSHPGKWPAAQGAVCDSEGRRGSRPGTIQRFRAA